MNHKEALFYYFEKIVKPTVEEFIGAYKDRCNIRRGVLASITLDHMRDYYLAYLNESTMPHLKKGALTKLLADECVEVLYIRDTCNISKHRELDQKPVYSYSSDNIVQEDKHGMFDAPFGQTFFAEASEVFLAFDDVGQVNLPDTVQIVLEFWSGKLNAI